MELTNIINKLRNPKILSRHHKDKINVFISIFPSIKGGGANTFAYNLKNWLLKNKTKYNIVYDIQKADKAVIIAHKADVDSIEKAKRKGCFIIHRLDEHVVPDEDEYRQKKHADIKKLNYFADITVYQSHFVFNNMHPFLDKPEKYAIILNGANPSEFYLSEKSGEYIGHVTWGVGEKKRLDIVYQTILENPENRFLLIGNHADSKFNFNSLKNVLSVGVIKRPAMLSYLHKMKFLFFPSENDPCPNTVIEAILSGIPVCYNPLGGTKEIVKDCGLVLKDFKTMLKEYSLFKQKCLSRSDLYFDHVARKYMNLGQ